MSRRVLRCVGLAGLLALGAGQLAAEYDACSLARGENLQVHQRVKVSSRIRDLGGCHLELLPTDDAAGLSLDEPGLIVDGFQLSDSGEAFHFGDQTTLLVTGTASFGNLLTDRGLAKDGLIWVQLAEGATVLCETSSPATSRVARFRASIRLEARRAGDSVFHARVRVRGEADRPLGDVPAEVTWSSRRDAAEEPSITVQSEPPVDAEIRGPLPERVQHGDQILAALRLTVRTMADVQVDPRLDGALRRVIVAGNATPEEERLETVASKRKSHPGCQYAPPHPPQGDIRFRYNGLNAVVTLSDGLCSRWFELRLADLAGTDTPFAPPECPAGKAYSEEWCECVSEESIERQRILREGRAYLYRERSTEGGFFDPRGVDGTGRGESFPPLPPPPGPSCGDGMRGAGEACDGLDLGGQSCVDFGFPGGVLACAADCSIDTSSCTIPEPPRLVASPASLEKEHERGGDTCPDPFDPVQLTNSGGGTINYRIAGQLPAWLALDATSGAVPGSLRPRFTCDVGQGDLDLQHDLVVQPTDPQSGQDSGDPAMVSVVVHVRSQ